MNRAITAIAALLPAMAGAQPNLQTTVLSIYQIGNGAGVHLGHIVSASTIYNRLTAGGTFLASCAHPDMSPARGQRILSTDNFGGGLRLVVTIPEVLPATMAMPGFYSLTRGTTVSCTYEWTSRAVEGGLSIGSGGVSFQAGNGERSEGFFQQFTMSVPGDTNQDDWQGCIP